MLLQSVFRVFDLRFLYSHFIEEEAVITLRKSSLFKYKYFIETRTNLLKWNVASSETCFSCARGITLNYSK